jgi:putative SOS response-associated peptidase YedK
MCGRYSLTTTRVDLARELGLPLEAVPEELVPRWNIAPTQPVAALRPGLRLDLLQWGLVPGWSKDPSIGSRLINARAETLDEKPSFRDAFRDRRCLVLADGFYEWKPADADANADANADASADEASGAGVKGRRKGGRSRGKTPYYIRLKSGGVFTFAGLWAFWRGRDGSEVASCTIVTGEPNAMVAAVHDRMPVIVPPENRDAWLDPDHTDPESLRQVLRTFPEDTMEMYPVTRHVNTPANDDAACIEPAPGDPDRDDGDDDRNPEPPPGGTLSLFD